MKSFGSLTPKPAMSGSAFSFGAVAPPTHQLVQSGALYPQRPMVQRLLYRCLGFSLAEGPAKFVFISGMTSKLKTEAWYLIARRYLIWPERCIV